VDKRFEALSRPAERPIIARVMTSENYKKMEKENKQREKDLFSTSHSLSFHIFQPKVPKIGGSDLCGESHPLFKLFNFIFAYKTGLD